MNRITDKLTITGRGTVLLCHDCNYKLGDTLTYENITYEVRGVELQGFEEPPYRIAGLLVRKINSIDE